MRGGIIAALLVATIFASPAGGAGEPLAFRSSEILFSGVPLTLTGELFIPAGSGPFPAVILMHGCGGKGRRQTSMARVLASWGYVALVVDSLGPRGVKEICTDSGLAVIFLGKRARDAHDAKAYLAQMPLVDPRRIAIIGWSHGGSTVLDAVRKQEAEPFRAAIAFYPRCEMTLTDSTAPLLILIGDADDWTPSALCERIMPKDRAAHEVTLKTYAGAYHGFDLEGADTLIRGARGSHRVKYNQQAAEDSIIQVKTFLEKHLK